MKIISAGCCPSKPKLNNQNPTFKSVASVAVNCPFPKVNNTLTQKAINSLEQSFTDNGIGFQKLSDTALKIFDSSNAAAKKLIEILNKFNPNKSLCQYTIKE